MGRGKGHRLRPASAGGMACHRVRGTKEIRAAYGCNLRENTLWNQCLWRGHGHS